MIDAMDIKILDYEGPLDLLVHLVYKNEMNIFDVSITDITNKFIAEIKNMRDMDIEIAAEFIYMASYLVYLKSRMLLPRDSVAEDELDPEEARFKFNQLLIEYSFYKDIAQELKQYERNSGRNLTRSYSLVILKEDIFTEDAYKLAASFFNISNNKKDKNMVVKNRQKAMIEVANSMRAFILSREKTLWSEIAIRCEEKIEKCVSLSTALELQKTNNITAHQSSNFDEILFSRV